jgi:hypothetical protein
VHGPAGKGWPWRAGPTGPRRERRATPARCARALERLVRQPFRLSLLRPRLSQKFPTKVHLEVNGKVGDLTTLYNFYKGRMGFFSTICAQNACQLGCFHGANEQCRTALITGFHPFTLQISNATQHESCVHQKTTQLSYWENLKCLGKIWRTRQKFRMT